MSEIKMRSPSGGKSSISVESSGEGVSIRFSRSSDGEVMVMLPRYAAEQLAKQISDTLTGTETVVLTRQQIDAILRAAYPFSTNDERSNTHQSALSPHGRDV
jgi:hypothetical protein